MHYKISVIVPVYNVENYLRKCLDSILGQTYGELEIICVDDGSKDKSGAILDEYAEKDSRLKVIHKANGGISSARNEGLKHVTGDFLTFCDSDDWIDPDMYEKMLNAAVKYNADVISTKADLTSDRVITDNILAEYLLIGSVSLWNKLFRYTDIIKNSFKFVEGDVDMRGCFDLFCTAEKWVIIPGAFYNYRQDNVSYVRSGLSHLDIYSVKINLGVAEKAKTISQELYKPAYNHVLHSEFNVISKVAMYGFKQDEIRTEYEKVRKSYVSDIRRHICEIRSTSYFTQNEKLQLTILSISYPLFMILKKLYMIRQRKRVRPDAIKS